MTEEQYKFFEQFRNDYQAKITEWNNLVPNLMDLQKEAAKKADTPDYSFETPIVYNRALDSIMQTDVIKIIVIGDNPGKDEQLLKNNKYLVGQAGKLGEGFFRNNPELEIDFRKNAIILNKTPVHTAKTTQIKYLLKNGGPGAKQLLAESQEWLAQKTAELCKVLGAEIWLVGYSELKPKKIFSIYREKLAEECKKNEVFDKVLVFQHFSMNRFSVDLKEFRKNNSDLSLNQAVHTLGKMHREEIFTDE